MNADDLVTLNEEIAGMARAGLPLDQGLAAMAREMGSGQLRRVTSALADDLRAGHPLPEALQRQGARVPPFYAGLVRAAARTGRVSEVLATLTVYARTIGNVRSMVADAFFYPAIVLVFALAVFGFFTFFILPQFELIFAEFHLNLPFVSAWAIWLARNPLRNVVLPLLGLIVGLLVVRIGLALTAPGRRWWARFVYAVPVLGTLIRSARMAAFTDLLAILIDYEVTLPEAFLLAGEASSDPIMAAKSRDVHDRLSAGRPLGEVLRGGLVPEWVAWMVGMGERRGFLGKTLHDVAGIYRRQVETRALLLRSVLPPFIILVTAVLSLGFFIVVILVPMIRLLEGLSK